MAITGPAMVFVTTTVIEWTPVFSHKECMQALINQLSETLRHFQVSLCGYVVMPSHVHLLLGLKEYSDLSKFMQAFKSLSARHLLPLMPASLMSDFASAERHSFWKPRFDELVIWSEKQFKVKLDYIHNNPVKAGLVNEPAEYYASSAADWILDRPSLLSVEKYWSWLGSR